MQGIELIVALLLASTVLAGVARAIHVHYAIVLVLGGLAVGLVSGTSAPQVDPHTVLFVFLPPLIYAASFSSSTQDLRTHAKAIGLLAVGLVLVSMTAVAAVAHAVAGIGWGPALVLGAILGPTDPIAATSVLRRLGAPDRISTILEGEALDQRRHRPDRLQARGRRGGIGTLLAWRGDRQVHRRRGRRGRGRVGGRMGLGGGPQAHRRAADRDQHLPPNRVPGLHPGRPHRRLGGTGRGGRRAVHRRPSRIDALTHLPASHLGILGSAHVPARVGPVPAHRTRAPAHHARSVGGKAASIFGSGPGHPHRGQDGLDVHGSAAGTARPSAPPPNAAGIAPSRNRSFSAGARCAAAYRSQPRSRYP